jgi:hypothetical protein
MRLRRALVETLLFSLFCACSNGDGNGRASKCEEIGEVCHEPDDEDGPLAACHDLGHVGNEQVCAERYDDCLAMCRAGLDAGAGGASGSGGSTNAGAGGR